MMYVFFMVIIIGLLVVIVSVVSLFSEVERLERVLVALAEKIDDKNSELEAKKPKGKVTDPYRSPTKPRGIASATHVIKPKSPRQIQLEHDEEFERLRRQQYYGNNSQR